MLLLLLTLFPMHPLVVSVEGNPASYTLCGKYCGPRLAEDPQPTIPHLNLGNTSFMPDSATPAVPASEITLQEQLLSIPQDNPFYNSSGEDVKKKMWVGEEARKLFGLVLKSSGAQLPRPSGEEGDHPTPTGLSQYLQRLRDLLKRPIVTQLVELLKESYRNAPSLEEMLTDLNEVLLDLNDRLPDPEFPPSDGSHDHDLVKNRTKRGDIFSFGVARNVLSTIQLILLFSRKLLRVGKYFYDKINIRA